jgi:hypothetical protein
MIATFIKRLESRVPGGIQELFRLDPPCGKAEYVQVSAIPLAPDTGRPETMVFRATEEGDVISYMDLAVVYRMDIVGALVELGYSVRSIE